MNFFKPKLKGRVVKACGGFIPQICWNEQWGGLDSDLVYWSCPQNQKKYCVVEKEKTANLIVESYLAISL